MDKVKRTMPLFGWRTTARLIKQITPTLGFMLMLGVYSQIQSFCAETAEPGDVENYFADGQQFELKKVSREVVTKLGSERDAGDWTAANGQRIQRVRTLAGGAMVYRIGDESSDANVVQETISILRNDESVRYAYPVFVNTTTGLKSFLNDRIVVRFAEGIHGIDHRAVEENGLRLIETLSGSENIHLFQLQQPKETNPFGVCRALTQDVEILWAEPDMALEIRNSVIPSDTDFGSQWHLRNTGQTAGFSDADSDVDDAWNASQGYGSPGIRIAIVDDGVETTHSELAGNIVAGYDFYSNDSNPNPTGASDHHGTAVAGIAAAVVNNSAGIAGVAGKCRILPVRISENGVLPAVSEVYKAMVFAGDNAGV